MTHAARGARHPETAGRHNNLAVMKAMRNDWPGAATDMERAVAIMLSLDLAEHPDSKGEPATSFISGENPASQRSWRGSRPATSPTSCR